MSKKIKAELLAIQGASKNRILHPARVLRWAKTHTKSALYRAIEWDNTKAAHEHRLDQVRRLIRMTIMVEDGTPRLVSLTFDRNKGGGYRPIDDVISNRDLSEIMLRDALNDLQRVQTRYQHVRELTGVWTAVKRVQQRRAKKITSKPQLAKAV